MYIDKHSHKYSSCEYFKGEHKTRNTRKKKKCRTFGKRFLHLDIPKAVKKA